MNTIPLRKRFFVRKFPSAAGNGWGVSIAIGYMMLWIRWRYIPEWYPVIRATGLEIGLMRDSVYEGMVIPSKRIFWHQESIFQDLTES